MKFGKKTILTTRNNITEGYWLSETSSGIVLEEYFDDTQQNVDIIAEFKGVRMRNWEQLRQCIAKAREYVGDPEATIYVNLRAYTEMQQ